MEIRMEKMKAIEEHADILEMARSILEANKAPEDAHNRDLVLCALIKGVEIGLMDSLLAQEVMRFAQEHERLKPEHLR
jgi:hypothetical protein